MGERKKNHRKNSKQDGILDGSIVRLLFDFCFLFSTLGHLYQGLLVQWEKFLSFNVVDALLKSRHLIDAGQPSKCCFCILQITLDFLQKSQQNKHKIKHLILNTWFVSVCVVEEIFFWCLF